jgi:hypothetical protein
MQIMKDAQRSKGDQKGRTTPKSKAQLSSSHQLDESLQLIMSVDVKWKRSRVSACVIKTVRYAARPLSEEGASMAHTSCNQDGRKTANTSSSDNSKQERCVQQKQNG